MYSKRTDIFVTNLLNRATKHRTQDLYKIEGHITPKEWTALHHMLYSYRSQLRDKDQQKLFEKKEDKKDGQDVQ